MKALTWSSLIYFSALIVSAGDAYAAQPPFVVPSDSNGNTAIGTDSQLYLSSGKHNTSGGQYALEYNMTSSNNTAFGWGALAVTLASDNTAIGAEALWSNRNGSDNTASGYRALFSNTTGSNNTATGASALHNNSTGFDNTAQGHLALSSNTTGVANTASGSRALATNTEGSRNTAIGVDALDSNTAGELNTSTGADSLYSNTIGVENTASGYAALYRNTSGRYNTAIGKEAMHNNDSGYRNVALGFQAGYAMTGSDNITIGAGNQGKSTESNVTRIGSKSYQGKAFIAGISGIKTGLAAAKTVFIDANGQLGTIKSSRVYKEDIHPMGGASERLLALQPVTFRYKEAYDDGSKPVEFGLIAEDVAEVFPELVVRDSEGKPETVRYDLIATLLLNEFEKERAIVQAQAERIAELEKQTEGLARLKQEFARMAETLERLDHASMVAASH